MNNDVATYVQPSVYLRRLVFSGGDEISFLPNEKILIVGANNSGKSKTLREIDELCSAGAQAPPRVVLREVVLEKVGKLSDLEIYLGKHAVEIDSIYRIRDWSVHKSNLPFWGHDYLVNGLAAGFVRNITAKDRLLICEQQQSIGPTDPMSKPQHVLYQDDALMRRVSSLFRRSFNCDLMFDFRGGNKLPIHVGDVPSGPQFVDRTSDAYTSAVRQLPSLDTQGDGMKSFAGILFETIASNRDVMFLDEPEAFLHPPQMRRIGETLAQEAKGQLFVATHSSDVLRGFLEGSKGNVRILRIRREGAENMVFEAPADAVKELWEKPALRYSNALEGVFHEQTIICEDDSDCRLFNSVASYLESQSPPAWKDTAYIPTGGKAAVRKVAAVLRQVGVPIKAILDIDFLAEGTVVRETVEAFGGNWEDVKPHWTRVDIAVRSGVRAKTTPEIKEAVKRIIDSSAKDELPKSKIADELKQTSPWAIVKKVGVAAIPAGDAYRQYEMLRDILEGMGIYLVPCGEAEGFCRQIGKHGPAFVTTLLSDIPLGDSSLQALRDFVAHVHAGAASIARTQVPNETALARTDASAEKFQCNDERLFATHP